VSATAGADGRQCGFCAIIGPPNAGKSTLVNLLAGTKVSIVSHKVQTTRSRLRAIFVEGSSQVILVDTPGIFSPKRKLDKAMVEAAWAGSVEADTTVVLIDPRQGLNEEASSILAHLKPLQKRVMLALNKADVVRPEALLKAARDFNEGHNFSHTFMISAATGSGVADLRKAIAQAMPASPWLYPADQAADVQMRFLASEITREKIYERLHDELPYASTVETEAWEEQRDGSVKINQVIYVERDGQKAIVLGKGGQMIKQLGQMARNELEQMLDRRVHLLLFVKVRENWMDDPARLRMMGLLE
jgi:GTP-binding protein Era